MFDHPETLIPLIFAVLAFLTVIGLGLPWLEPDIFASRLKIINQRRGELSQQRKQRLDQARPSLRRMTSGRVNFMRIVLEKLNAQEHHRAAGAQEEADARRLSQPSRRSSPSPSLGWRCPWALPVSQRSSCSAATCTWRRRSRC